jgi:pimeloyl-ACP methyl ester carboxylesterase
MPKLCIDADLSMHYEIDDYADPWTTPETILMLHGNSECGAVWYGWVPTLARHFRVVRPDMRGFGQSTPMPRDFAWSLDRLIDDYMTLMARLGIEHFHLIAAKIGGTIARAFAARRPDAVRTLTVAGTPPPYWQDRNERTAAMIEDFERNGLRNWATSSMANRLGARFPQEGVRWWTELMASSPVSTQLGFSQTIACADIRADLPRIQCPTLVITTEGSALGSVEITRTWQQMIPRSELLVLPGNSYHVAASDAEACARAALAFIRGS